MRPFSFLGGGPTFSIADLSPDFYFRAPYAGSPWPPTAPGNTHGNLVKSGGNAPTVGPLVNGFAPARLNFANGLAQALKAATAVSTDILDATQFTVLAFVQQFGLQNDDANFRNEASIANDQGVQWGLSVSRSGYRGGIFDPGFGPRQTAYVPTSFGATTIAAGSNGAVLPQAVINVASTAGANPTGRFCVNTATGRVEITYTGIAGNAFTGCAGGAGQSLATGQDVTAMVWAMAVLRYDIIHAKLRLSQPSGTTDVQVASTTVPNIAGAVPFFGESENSGAQIQGDYLELATWKRVVVDADLVKAAGYLSRRYAQPLT